MEQSNILSVSMDKKFSVKKEPLKILNLHAGIGGNRARWEEIDVDIEVVAVEIDKEIAAVYSDYFPRDQVVVGDAREYLVEHYQEFDFIWSSPSCITHSKIRVAAAKNGRYKPVLPDLMLYSEIIFLGEYAGCPFVVENVRPYYTPLIPWRVEIDRHVFWTNFVVPTFKPEKAKIHNEVGGNQQVYGFDLKPYSMHSNKKREIIRNLVPPETGLHLLEWGLKKPKRERYDQVQFEFPNE